MTNGSFEARIRSLEEEFIRHRKDNHEKFNTTAAELPKIHFNTKVIALLETKMEKLSEKVNEIQRDEIMCRASLCKMEARIKSHTDESIARFAGEQSITNRWRIATAISGASLVAYIVANSM